MRNSDWKITWDPAGAALVLLDLDDLMESEIRFSRAQLAATGKPDFATRVSITGRANVRSRLDFGRRLPHATAVQSWQAALDALQAAPWNAKGILSIEPRGAAARSYTAALLNSSHRPATDDGLIESVHGYSFRLIPI